MNKVKEICNRDNELQRKVNNGITANRINTCKINDIVFIYNTLFKEA